MEALQAEISGLLTPGNELVVAGAIALYGTAQIAREKHEILREHFSEGFLREAENLRTLYGTADEINVKEAGATAFYAMGEGGFLSALWKWIFPRYPYARRQLKFVKSLTLILIS